VADSRSTSQWYRDARAWPLAASGLLLCASGLGFLGVWAVLGGPWEGPITWRKPILFGISGGLTAISIGWAFAKLPTRRWDVPLAWSATVALLVEVGLIDLQKLRGVASHFNRTTPLDSIVYDLMGGLILWVTAVSFDLMLRYFFRPPRDPAACSPDMLLAIRGGLVALVWSCLLGIWVSVNGEIRLEQGLEPDRFGAAGVPKFAHGAVIHALQWLPFLAWTMRRVGVGEQARLPGIAAATLGTLLVAAYALLQTLEGLGRFDATLPSAALLALGVLLLAVPAGLSAASAALRRRPVAAAGGNGR